MRTLIYQRYLAKSIIPPLIIVTLVITSIGWITQSLHYLFLLDKGIGLFQFLGLILLIFPSLLFITLPFLTLFSVLYTYYHLSEERQLVIFKNAAISDIRLTAPAIFVALCITIFSYYLSFDLMPKSYNNLRNEISFLQDKYISKIINEREFTQVTQKVVLYVASKSSNDILKGIVLFDDREGIGNNEHSTILFAKQGQISSVNQKIIFKLKNGYRQSYDSNNNLTRLYFDSLIVELATNTDKSNSRSRGFREFYVDELFERGAALENSSQNKNKYLIEGHQRIIWPLFSIILSFVALAIWFKSSYIRGSNTNIIYIILCVITLITYLHFIFLHMALRNINYIYLCYVNLVCCIIISFILFFITENEISRFKKVFRLFRK